MQKNHYRRLLRAGKLSKEPQPYLEPRSPRLKVPSQASVSAHTGGASLLSVGMQALGLERVDVVTAGAGSEPGASSTPTATSEGGASGSGGGGNGSGGGVRVVVLDEDNEEVKVKPAPGTLYHDLGEFEPVNLLSFAYQIASGMVSLNT